MTANDVSIRAANPHAQARLAGALYAIVVLTGIFSLSYAPSLIFAGDTAAAIAQSASAHAYLLRQSIAVELACYVAFAGLALALYRLFANIDQFAALLMTALALSSVPFGYANITHLLEILRIIDSNSLQPGDGAITALYEQYVIGLRVQAIPWGLWLIPFGYLTIRSGFLPRILGVLLILGGVGYVATFLGRLLIDGFDESPIVPVLRTFRPSEMLICVWLLVFGARRSLWGRNRDAAVQPLKP